MRYRFLDFVLDTDQQALIRAGVALPLRRQSYRVLLHLLERAPAMVSKDELLDAVWGHQSISQSAVAQTIRELRDLLDDDANDPRVIQTRHRFGYQFIAELVREGDAKAAAASPDGHPAPLADGAASIDAAWPGATQRPAPSRQATTRRRFLALGLLAAALAGVAVLALMVGRSLAPANSDRGWPADAAVADELAAILDAARRLDHATALPLIERLRASHDTPRLSLLEARLRLNGGQTGVAAERLAELAPDLDGLARRDQLLHEALGHELVGRYHQALASQRIAFEVDPGDVDVGLDLFELQDHEADATVSRTLERLEAAGSVPPQRLLLLKAQRAGQVEALEQQVGHAEAILAEAAAGSVLAARARLARAQARRRLGHFDSALSDFRAAGESLEASGCWRMAAEGWLESADALLVQGELDAASDRLAALDQRFRALGDAYMHGRILHNRARLAARAGRSEEAIGLYAAAAERHQVVGNDDGVASALSAQAGPMRRMGQVDAARAGLMRALSYAERTGTDSVLAGVHGNLANLNVAQGRLEEAEQHFQAALSRFRRVGERRLEAVTLGNIANAAVLAGDIRRADNYNQQALAVFRELGMARDIARIQVQLAQSARQQGDLGQARTRSEEALQLFRRQGQANDIATALAVLADVHVQRADMARARSALDEARALDGIDLPGQAQLATVEGLVARLAGDGTAAATAFGRALALRERVGDRAEARASRTDLARLQIDRRQFVLAEQAMRGLAAEAVQDGNPGDEAQARLVLAEALQGLGRREDAERELAQARGLLDRAPQFDAGMQWTLLRARLDRDPGERAQRLDWVQDEALRVDHPLWLLRVRGERLADAPPEALQGWQADLARLSLTGLAGQRVVIQP